MKARLDPRPGIPGIHFLPRRMSRIIVASGLGSISSIHPEGRRDEALFDAWQQLIRSTLRAFVSELSFFVCPTNNVACLSPVFAALGKE
jgi:hypothetical protein